MATPVRSGPATDDERANLARRLAAAQPTPAGTGTPAPPAGQPPPAPAPAPRSATPPPQTRTDTGPGWRPTLPTLGGGAQAGAGFILGLFVWGWVIMPLINGGPTKVRDTLRAKFLNKAPDGSWLP